jgi:hypothetical protein
MMMKIMNVRMMKLIIDVDDGGMMMRKDEDKE